MAAGNFDLTSMSVDELWSLHEEISTLLSTRILQEKRELEKRLAILNRSGETVRESVASRPVAGKPRRAYPEVLPRYRNPATSETWSGRGKKPRWMAAALAAGHEMDEFLITDPHGSATRPDAPKAARR